MQRKTKSAFTLIELLVVIAIIGILATLAIVALQQARQNARDAKRVADVKQVSTALELFFNDNQSYPDALEELQTGGYMQILPSAPSVADGGCLPEDNNYSYSVSANKDFYQLRFCTGKQASDLTPGNVCMTPGGLTTNCSAAALAPDPNPLCDVNEAVTFADANGNGYYDVRTCCELSAIRNNPSANYELVNNLNCSNSENWTGYEYPTWTDRTISGFPVIDNFSGSLNGNNFAINNIHLYDGINGFAGIFSNTQSASVSVSNLRIINPNLNHSQTHAAGILFSMSNGPTTLNNVSISGGTISHPSGNFAGGLIGYMSGYLSIVNSFIDGLNVNFSSGGSGFGFFAGGDVSGGGINNSYIKDSTLTIGSNGGVGGFLVNASNVVVENSYVENLEINALSGGSSFGCLFNRFNSSSIIDSGVSGCDLLFSASGSVGGVGGITAFSSSGNFENVFVNNLNVNAPGISLGNVGSISGNPESISVNNSHANNINLDVLGGNVGGLIGCISSSPSSEINLSSVNNIIITRRGSGTTGGILGCISGPLSLSDSYFYGEINAIGGENVGGILGAQSALLTLNNTYSASVINYTGSDTFIRCDIGYRNFRISTTGDNNYYNSTICNANGGLYAAPLTTTQMKDSITSYTNWNINTPSCSGADDTNPWRWTAGNYPCLYSDSTCTCS